MNKIYSFKLKWLLCVLAFMCVVAAFVVGVFVWKLDGIYSRVSVVKEYFETNLEYQWMHQEIDVSNFDEIVLSDEEDAWYTKYHIIAHGGGAVDGKVYTNSVEAWDAAYAAGTRIFDADLSLTCDGVLVLRHSWSDNLEQIENVTSTISTDDNGTVHYSLNEATIMTSEDFLSTPIYYKYTAMDCEDMIQYMLEHDDLYVAIDTKDDVTLTYEYLLDTVYALGAEEILERIILSVYNEAEYLEAMSLYTFNNVVARQYAPESQHQNYYDLLTFCLEYNIHVVNLSKCYVDDEGVTLLMEHGVNGYVATVDWISEMETLAEKGFSGAVSNYLTESDYWYIGQ